jgi:hypothetical protein
MPHTTPPASVASSLATHVQMLAKLGNVCVCVWEKTHVVWGLSLSDAVWSKTHTVGRSVDTRFAVRTSCVVCGLPFLITL